MKDFEKCYVLKYWVGKRFFPVNSVTVRSASHFSKWPCNFHGQRYSKLQKKRARNPVPICPFNQLQPANRPLAGWGCLKGHFGTELRARFSSAWSNVEFEWYKPNMKYSISMSQKWKMNFCDQKCDGLEIVFFKN